YNRGRRERNSTNQARPTGGYPRGPRTLSSAGKCRTGRTSFFFLKRAAVRTDRVPGYRLSVKAIPKSEIWQATSAEVSEGAGKWPPVTWSAHAPGSKLTSRPQTPPLRDIELSIRPMHVIWRLTTDEKFRDPNGRLF